MKNMVNPQSMIDLETPNQVQDTSMVQKETKKGLFSRIFSGSFFRKKPKEEEKPPVVHKEMSDESEIDQDERKKDKPAFEIDSDDEEDGILHARDVVQRMTLMKDQFDKLKIHDDFDFGEIYKSLVVRNASKFDFSETTQ